MKARIILSVLSSFVFYLLSSQVPQGINYQGLAGDASGNPIRNTDLQVKISILSDTLPIATVWEELHSNLKTDAHGIFSLVVGTGLRQPASSVATFNEISWSVTHLFIKTQIYYRNSWKDMGSAKLWTVPYAMVAGELACTVKKLSVTGITALMDEALFEVKNKTGQTVFAVYNEGVRIYVDDGAKSAKGGFAIGGFNTSKAPAQEYFVVNADSIRAYIYDDPLIKKPKGGFAIGGFNNSKGLTNDYFLISPDSSRVYLNNAPSNKGAKGGFAIGGFDVSKGSSPRNLMTVSDDSIRMYINSNSKSPKGGFAIGGFDNAKGPINKFLDLTPQNYFIGHESGLNNISGLYNSFLGFQSGKSNSDGSSNIFIGYQSGYSNILGSDNTFVGYQAGYSNIGNNYPGVFQHGKWNCFFGYQAGYSNVQGDFNTFLGYESGKNNIASLNTFVGYKCGSANTEGSYNTFMGVSAGLFNSIGSNNIFFGHQAGYCNSDGNNNIFIGEVSGATIKSGNYNIVLGSGAASGTVYNQDGTGSSNVIIGFEAGKYLKNGSSNIFIGTQAGYNETGSNLLYIDNSSENAPLVYGNFATNKFRINGDIEYTGSIAAFSDIRLKKNITGLENVLEKLNLIKGVYFDWNQNDTTGLLLTDGHQIGVIAQDVEKVYPELVTTNEKGYKMVDYSKLTPVLIEAIKEQQQQIESSRQENQQLKSELKLIMERMTEIETMLAGRDNK